LSTTLLLPGEPSPLSEAEAVRARLEHEVDLVIDVMTQCGGEVP
jgi:tRNA A37 threonylcarbamoyladenosine synthetase subunit TsaC/SUA5/YrdC